MLKDLIRIIKSKPDYILDLKIFDDPGREIEIPPKFRIVSEIEVEYELRNICYRYESNTKINMVLNNEHFNNLTYIYEKGLRISNNSDPTILEFTPRYKIAGTFFPIKNKWFFSEFYREDIENDRLNITSEIVYNIYKNQNSEMILKLNNNRDLIRSFNKIYNLKNYYDVPFIYLGSQDLDKSLIRSMVFESDPKAFLYMISLFEKFHETLVLI
jgi:hypothetical protein